MSLLLGLLLTLLFACLVVAFLPRK